MELPFHGERLDVQKETKRRGSVCFAFFSRAPELTPGFELEAGSEPTPFPGCRKWSWTIWDNQFSGFRILFGDHDHGPFREFGPRRVKSLTYNKIGAEAVHSGAPPISEKCNKSAMYKSCGSTSVISLGSLPLWNAFNRKVGLFPGPPPWFVLSPLSSGFRTCSVREPWR